MRFVRSTIVATVTAGIVLAIIAGWSYASPSRGQVGYGAPQVVPDQIISGQHASSSHLGLWIGILAALLILALTGFLGWKKTHSSDYV